MGHLQNFRPPKNLLVGVVTVLSSIFLLSATLFVQHAKSLSVTYTATAQTWPTRISMLEATSMAEAQGTVTMMAATAQNLVTGAAISRKTAVAEAQSTAAILAETRTVSKIRRTVTAQIRATDVARVYKRATARAQATATARRQGTATTQSWQTAIAVAQSTSVAQVGATTTSAVQETATAQSYQGSWLIIEVSKVTVLSDKRDGLDGDIEFVMYVTASDGNSSVILSYPAENHVLDVLPGRPIRMDKYALAMDESQLQDDLAIYFVALDSDEQSLDEGIPWDLFGSILQQSFLKFVQRIGKLSKLSKLPLPGIGNFVEWAYKYFNLIDESGFVLHRSENWHSGKMIKYTSPDLEIEFRIHWVNKPPGEIIITRETH